MISYIHRALWSAMLAVWCLGPAMASDEPVVVDRATRDEREAFREKWQTRLPEIFSGQLTVDTESEWQGGFWAAGLTQDRSPMVRHAIAHALATLPERSPAFRRAALEALHTLFPGEFTAETEALLPTLDHPRLFAMAAYHVLRSPRMGPDSPAQLIRRERARLFPEWQNHPILRMIDRELERWWEHPRPPLEDLLRHEFLPGLPVIFSFQRPDRRHPGLVMLRAADGRFARHDTGELLAWPQLALSLSNMPGTITNGNTPQGLFSISGTGQATNVFIGPTPYIHSRLPHEVSLDDYMRRNGSGDSAEWSRADYEMLLPESWREDASMFEAYEAGRAGRSEIIVHGTTINPAFYEGTSYYPMTPSLGCLCTIEIWSEDDGTAIRSDQRELVEAWKALPGADRGGVLVVLELAAEARPVELADVLEAIARAEAPPTNAHHDDATPAMSDIEP